MDNISILQPPFEVVKIKNSFMCKAIIYFPKKVIIIITNSEY
jgi:type III secretory pathway component EscR